MPPQTLQLPQLPTSQIYRQVMAAKRSKRTSGRPTMPR